MKCKNCNKEGAYVRVKTKDIRCGQCGHIQKLDFDWKPEVKDEEPTV